jgi:hypothetical protein
MGRNHPPSDQARHDAWLWLAWQAGQRLVRKGRSWHYVRRGVLWLSNGPAPLSQPFPTAKAATRAAIMEQPQ